MKKCKECGAEKPISQYYKVKSMKDGHLNKCIECVKARVKRHRDKNIEKIRAYDRARGNRQSYEYIKDFRKRFPKKYKAHCSVRNAIARGALKKMPCEICGYEKAVAHHDDYDYPLSIRWLCQAHHKQWHAKNGQGLNAI